MPKRMLIDASHPEETRVVVQSGNRLEDFDFETTSKKQLKGNIYLAKITRVEPSLQAAFVDYGGNRHGFLPFSEIHPDYYRIPIADREALLAEEAAAKSDDDGEDPESETTVAEEAMDGEAYDGAGSEPKDLDSPSAEPENGDANGDGDVVEEVSVEAAVDTVGGDEIEEAARRRAKLLRRYKIQEVIKRRQIILVQVSKEERGNKGAALTTYLSLAGRYCVLMPNTNKGGGISRKISNASDRRRLKQVLGELSIPEGIAVIVRTAGSRRSKAEIRRDYEYLMRLWNEIRETTLNSTAPCLIYEEANLIKRAIRDLYTSEMDEIQVEGEEGYKAAKSFMKSLMPSHAKKVQLFDDGKVPLFQRHQIEAQLDAMHSTTVRLRSGGYIVLNPTEALVAIDVNSGKATRERHIEETALKTNVEAAEEVGRQLKLRDLAGLIVIDFIDMENSRHNREVERKLKDALRNDRARIQLGRISPFGLLEMSRQRLRPSLFESSHTICSRCEGTGYLRTVESSALHILRSLEEDSIRRGGGVLRIGVAPDIALYILNQKRDRLLDIERRHDLKIEIATDEGLTGPDFRLDRLSSTGGKAAGDLKQGEEIDERDAEDGDRRRGRRRRSRRREEEEMAPAAKPQGEESAQDPGATEEIAGPGESDEKPKKRRRRGKRGGRRRSRGEAETSDSLAAADAPEDAPARAPDTIADDEPPAEAVADNGLAVLSDAPSEAEAETEAPTEKPKRRRASRAKKAAPDSAPSDGDAPEPVASPPEAEAALESEAPSEAKAQAEEKPKRKRTTRSTKTTGTKRPSRRKMADETAPAEPATEAPEPKAPRESPQSTREAPAEMEDTLPAAAAATSANGGAGTHDDQPKRRGWWSRFV